MDSKQTSSTSSDVWNEPTQKRGQERVSALLDAARELISESGNLDFKMTDIPKRAGVPVGSLYQFFPTRRSLLMRLFEIEMQPIDEALLRGIANVNSKEDFIAGVRRQMAFSIHLVKSRPCLLVIWASPSSDLSLADADCKNTEMNARLLSEKLIELCDDNVNVQSIETTVLLICHLWGSVTRLCILSPERADIIQEEYVRMVQSHLRRILE